MRMRLSGLGRKPSRETIGDDVVNLRERDSGGNHDEYSRHNRYGNSPGSSYLRGREDYSAGYESGDLSHYGRGYGSPAGYGSSEVGFQVNNFAQKGSEISPWSISNNNGSSHFQVGSHHSSIPYGSTAHTRQSCESGQGDHEEISKKVRVKPHSAFDSATYMNEIDLYQCMMAGSSKFEFLTSYLNPSTKATRRAKVPGIVQRQFGSPKEDGRVGSLRLEILGCVGLDRVKPEVSVYVVCGDSAFTTDIIEGNRSPMWPNSSKRAAVFPIHHAYARAFIGVFDVKQQKEREADYLCGRVTIDIPSLRPNTEYDITFPLRASSFIYDRRPRGVVRVRFSIHWFSERSAVLSYLKRPRNPLAFSRQAKKFPTIPCGDPKTFRNVAVTVHGQGRLRYYYSIKHNCI